MKYVYHCNTGLVSMTTSSFLEAMHRVGTSKDRLVAEDEQLQNTLRGKHACNAWCACPKVTVL